MDPFTADPAVYMMPNVDVPADQWADPAFSLGKSAQIGERKERGWGSVLFFW